MANNIQFDLPQFPAILRIIPENPSPRRNEMILALPLAIDRVAQNTLAIASPTAKRKDCMLPPTSPNKSPKKMQENSPCNTPKRKGSEKDQDERKDPFSSPTKLKSPSRTHQTSPWNQAGEGIFTAYENNRAAKKIKGKEHHTILARDCYNDAKKIRANRLKPNSDGVYLVPHENGDAHYRVHKAGENFCLYPSHTSTHADMIHLTGKQFHDLLKQYQSSNSPLTFREYIQMNKN